MSGKASKSRNSGGQRSSWKRKQPTSASAQTTSNLNSKSIRTGENQKTLGMAWGSNSLSASASSSRRSPFSDFSSYMVEKNRKLQSQFDAEASTSSNSGKKLFLGVSIFVDGFTIPSSQELRAYMLTNGGQFQNYFSRKRVTHIICSNLPDSKIKNLRSFSGGLPVVKPTWIVDSVLANRLLSWVPYQLDQLANNQPKLSAFFSCKSIPVSQDALTGGVFQANVDPSLKGGTSNHANLFMAGEPTEQERQMEGQIDEPTYEELMEGQGNTPTHKTMEPRTGGRKSSELVNVEKGCSDVDDCNSLNNGCQSSPHEVPSSVSYQNMKEGPDSTFFGPSSCPHSPLGDPNFVENYFKSSRLHFIGTWRSRYRKRQHSLNGLFKGRSVTDFDSSQKTIIHIDMDCFFVSVVIRNNPELHDKPVAICHSDNSKGTAEISSANYPARAYGIKAGMFVREAKALCQHLIIFPYNFQAYEEVADQFYSILHKHCNKVQAVSCDEAFLDITSLDGGDPELLASTIRGEIFDTTGCTASAGIGGNMLMAHLATRTAKPNGQLYILPEKVDEYLDQLPIKALPGVGHVLGEKLKKQNVSTCGQLQLISKESLQKHFGVKTGEMLWNYSRGLDHRVVGEIQESKSIGADVNWGVRFKDQQDSEHFLSKLCKEVSLRLQGCGVQGRTFTLKIKKRRKDAGEPVKYMGCGDCENLSHSMTVPIATGDVEVLQRITKQLFGSFHVDVKEIRGIGLQVSRLENIDSCRQGLERNTLRSWLHSSSAAAECQFDIRDSKMERISGTTGQSNPEKAGVSDQTDHWMAGGESHLNGLAPPSFFQLDLDVVQSLPAELFSELNAVYGGKLVDFLAKKKGKTGHISGSSRIPQQELAEGSEGTESVHVVGGVSTLDSENIGLMPSSLSQIDHSVLEQLPDELRVDILEQLPPHREQATTSNTEVDPLKENIPGSSDPETREDQFPKTDTYSVNSLWVGNPPRWVAIFKNSNSRMLNMASDVYYKLGSGGNLSRILQHAISEYLRLVGENDDGCLAEATDGLCKLLKQYIELKIQQDIEEIYICFRLLRRFTKKSNFLRQVYDNVFPSLQASVGEHYGGEEVKSLMSIGAKIVYNTSTMLEKQFDIFRASALGYSATNL